jgi:hypothetical protein
VFARQGRPSFRVPPPAPQSFIVAPPSPARLDEAVEIGWVDAHQPTGQANV